VEAGEYRSLLLIGSPFHREPSCLENLSSVSWERRTRSRAWLRWLASLANDRWTKPTEGLIAALGGWRRSGKRGRLPLRPLIWGGITMVRFSFWLALSTSLAAAFRADEAAPPVRSADDSQFAARPYRYRAVQRRGFAWGAGPARGGRSP